MAQPPNPPEVPADVSSEAQSTQHSSQNRARAEQAESALDEAEHGRLLQRALLEGMLDPVLVIDQLGTVKQVSRSVREVFGYTNEDLLGCNIKMIMPEPHLSQHDDYLRRYRETGETHILGSTREFQVVHKNGDLVDIELSVCRVDATGHAEPLFVGSFRDITERKRRERREVSMLRALATLGESTAQIVHEIKNPITAVNMALRAVADQLGEDQEEILGELVSRMQRLETQMRQSLAFARPLELVYTPLEARPLFEDVGQFLRPMLTRAGVELDIDVEPGTPIFHADSRRIEEVLSNLVANAMEMLEPGGRILLTASLADPATISLRVEDDGPGISPSVRHTLFQPFVTTKEEGTGLGLPICRRIMEDHDGSLDAEECSANLGGASFRVLLPVARPSSVGRTTTVEGS